MDHAVFQITRDSKEFPKLLKNIYDVPRLLFGRGQLLQSKDIYFSIVGTRRPSLYGKSMVQKFAAELSGCGFVIVSGLAFGIDEIAHRACLEAGGKTIAVLGSGLETLTSRQQFLAKDIEKTGTLLTEYGPHVHGTEFTYPARNRIIAGMSIATLIIEAPERSGALITARQALTYGRAVFVLPANVTQESSRGGNQFLRDSKAHPVTSVQDIFDYFEIWLPGAFPGTFSGAPQTTNRNGHTLTDEEETVYTILKESSRTFDELAQTSEMPIPKLAAVISLLEIKGYVTIIGSTVFLTH